MDTLCCCCCCCVFYSHSTKRDFLSLVAKMVWTHNGPVLAGEKENNCPTRVSVQGQWSKSGETEADLPPIQFNTHAPLSVHITAQTGPHSNSQYLATTTEPELAYQKEKDARPQPSVLTVSLNWKNLGFFGGFSLSKVILLYKTSGSCGLCATFLSLLRLVHLSSLSNMAITHSEL